MNDLEQKYIDDKLRPEELADLRKHLSESTDDDVAATLEEVWTGDIDTSAIGQDRLGGVKERIDEAIRRTKGVAGTTGRGKNHSRGAALAWAHAAAAAVILFFISAAIYLYTGRDDSYGDQISFATGKGEKASLTLPDGTEVALGYDSRLAYNPSEFNRKGRHVNLSGEAYFDVAKAHGSPFTISNDRIEVKVVGTRFNLQVRRNRPFARLTLDEGSVLFTSVKTGRTASVTPGSTATLDYASGGITVEPSDAVGDMKSWMNGELDFKNEPLNHVLLSLEEAYGISVKTQGGIIADSFTGTLPTGNVVEALRILGQAYGLDYSIDGNAVTLRAR